MFSTDLDVGVLFVGTTRSSSCSRQILQVTDEGRSRTMTDHSVTPQHNPSNAELLAANAALLAENKRMAELLASK
ncbi:hypothetical protein AHAS_Ahas19G0019200 [Arachis hypogaea]